MFRVERALRYCLIKHPTKTPWTHHTTYSLSHLNQRTYPYFETLPGPNHDRRSFSQTTGPRIVVVSLGLM